MRFGRAVAVPVSAVWIACAGLALASRTAQAQAAPAAEVSDLSVAVAKTAFDALPEAERRAIQDALTWTEEFSGVSNGVFGKRTFDAIVAYAKRNKLPAIGTLDDKGRAGLLAAAAKAKADIGFAAVFAKESGIRIAYPAKTLTHATKGKDSDTFATPDESARLELFKPQPGDDTLAALFEKTGAGLPAGKVTYKLLRPNFFVISSEVNGRAFYTRVASARPDGVAPLAGFRFSYPVAQKSSLARVTIAIANSFEPFGQAGAATAGNPPVPVAVPVTKATLAGTALALSPTLAIAALPGECADPTLGKTKAKITRRDGASGMVVLEATGLQPQAVAASLSTSGDVVVLFFPLHAEAAGAAQLSATAGEIIASAAPRLRAPMQGGQSGGVAFDRAGGLLGFVTPAPPPLAAGPAAPSSYGLVLAQAALGATGQAMKPAADATPPRTVGQIAADWQKAIIAVTCAR